MIEKKANLIQIRDSNLIRLLSFFKRYYLFQSNEDKNLINPYMSLSSKLHIFYTINAEYDDETANDNDLFDYIIYLFDENGIKLGYFTILHSFDSSIIGRRFVDKYEFSLHRMIGDSMIIDNMHRTFGSHFTSSEIKSALRTLKNYTPELNTLYLTNVV